MPGNHTLSRREVLRLVSGALALPALLAACSGSGDPAPTASPEPTATPQPSATPMPELGLSNSFNDDSLDIVRAEDLNAAGHYDEVRVSEDGTRHLIPLAAVEWGGVAKDGIPSIEAPRFVTPETADEWLEAREPVIELELGDDARAYPIQILMWHEIVNDEID